MNEHPSAFVCAIYMDASGILCLCLEEKRKRKDRKEGKAHRNIKLCCCSWSVEMFVMQILDFTLLRPYMSKEKSLFCGLLAEPEDKKMIGPECAPIQQLVVLSASLVPLSVSFPMTGAQTQVPPCPLWPPGDPDTLHHLKKKKKKSNPFLINVSSP